MNSPGPIELIIIGTLHSRHNTAKRYMPEALRQILLALRPHLICTETEARHIGDDGYYKLDLEPESLMDKWPDGVVPDQVARQLGIRQVSFERDGRDQRYRETRYFEREERAYAQFQELVSQLASSDPMCVEYKIAEMLDRAEKCQLLLDQSAGPEIINSEAFDHVIRIKHSCSATLLPLLTKYGGYEEMIADLRFYWEEWEDRNTIMADNLTRICGEHPGQRLVAVTGCEHRYALRDRLAGRPGIALREFWEVLDCVQQLPEASEQLDRLDEAAGASPREEAR